jgi:hypothetical protein
VAVATGVRVASPWQEVQVCPITSSAPFMCAAALTALMVLAEVGALA